jgi:peptidoglycan hydrolase-like protein with peptidoglycan-binding domain
MPSPRRLRALLAAACLTILALLAGAAPASAVEFGERTLREGMQGDDVRALQRKLTRLGFETEVSGHFGTQTERRMKQYERHYELRVNGACSRRDARHIERQLRRRRAGSESGGTDGSDYEYASRGMGPGDRGSDVTKLQRFLTRLGLDTTVDGHYGETTRRNVKRWEAWRYRRVNGAVAIREAEKIREQARSGAQYVRRAHVFPVRGRHDYGGAGSRFGADRGDHVHQGQDISAAEGTKLVAVHDGEVAYRQYQAGGAGHYLVIHGRDGSDSVYMHLRRRGIVSPGQRVLAGQRIGSVGSTGSSTGAHLHFELWTPHWFDGGSPYDPLPKLRRWDRQT